jgi:hypothetical protein
MIKYISPAKPARQLDQHPFAYPATTLCLAQNHFHHLCLSNDHDHARFAANVAPFAKQS